MEEDLNELRQDMIQEAREDELLEYHLRTDEDKIYEWCEEDILKIREAYENICKQYKKYDWDEPEIGELL